MSASRDGNAIAKMYPNWGEKWSSQSDPIGPSGGREIEIRFEDRSKYPPLAGRACLSAAKSSFGHTRPSKSNQALPRISQRSASLAISTEIAPIYHPLTQSLTVEQSPVLADVPISRPTRSTSWPVTQRSVAIVHKKSAWGTVPTPHVSPRSALACEDAIKGYTFSIPRIVTPEDSNQEWSPETPTSPLLDESTEGSSRSGSYSPMPSTAGCITPDCDSADYDPSYSYQYQQQSVGEQWLHTWTDQNLSPLSEYKLNALLEGGFETNQHTPYDLW